jgi:hypothetical protein
MKSIKNWFIGIVLIALPAAGYFAPQYAPFIPVAQDLLEYLAGDNTTIMVK